MRLSTPSSYQRPRWVSLMMMSLRILVRHSKYKGPVAGTRWRTSFQMGVRRVTIARRVMAEPDEHSLLTPPGPPTMYRGRRHGETAAGMLSHTIVRLTMKE